jgi:hypothetical protein
MANDPELPGPVYAPEEVAHVILRCAEHATRDVTVGGTAMMNTTMGTLAPRLTDYYMEKTMFQKQQKDHGTGRPDALYTPTQDGSRRGSTGSYELRRATTTRARMSAPGRALPYVALGGALVALGMRAMRRAA